MKRMFGKREEKPTTVRDIRVPKIVYKYPYIEEDISKWIANEIRVNNSAPKMTTAQAIGEILLGLGFKSDETIVLDHKGGNYCYDYHCTSRFVPPNSKIILECSNNEEYADIKINDGDIEKIYDFTGFDELGAKLKLNKTEVKYNDSSLPHESVSKITGNRYIRTYHQYEVNICLKSGEHSDYSTKIKIMAYNRKPNGESIVLPNEDQLELFMIHQDVPLDIVALYHKICELCLPNGNIFATFEIVTEKDFQGRDIITDHLKFTNGEIELATITKNNKTVTWDINQNQWTYATPELIITEFNDQTIDYSLLGSTEEELKSRVFSEDLQVAKTEVETTMKLAKTLDNKNNQ